MAIMSAVIANSETHNNKKNWHARLELAYKKTQCKTILSHRLHKGPLVVQKPFYPEEDVCHNYLIHPPGGIVGGDILELDVVMQPESHALITIPAATKFYRSTGSTALLNQKIKIKKNAVMEWLPQETIFYNDCRAKIHTEFDLEENAKLICWEINCFGRPAGNEYYTMGWVEQKISVKRNGIPLYIDRNIVDPDSGIMQASWGLNKYSVMATMLLTLPNESTNSNASKASREALKKLQNHSTSYIFSFTQREDILVMRYFGHHARQALALFTECWSLARPILLEKKSCPPRIWAT